MSTATGPSVGLGGTGGREDVWQAKIAIKCFHKQRLFRETSRIQNVSSTFKFRCFPRQFSSTDSRHPAKLSRGFRRDEQLQTTSTSLVQLRAHWCNLVWFGVTSYKFVQLGAGWCNLVQIGTTWCRLVQLGVDWCNLVQVSATWCSLVQLGAVWCNLVQFIKT